ncbi:MAG TPA: GAF domain-containing protein, partial [Anaerolineae bacterium]|nr:GAF domain-containing protein [Anaerolineae bacterium]
MANSNPTFLTTLQGRWLNLARLVWFAVTFMATGMLVMGLLALADSLADPPPETVRLLQQLGLSLDLFVGYVVAYHAVFGLVYLALAGLVFWRKSDDRLAIFISLAILSIGLTELSQFGNPLLNRYPLWYWPMNGLQAFAYAATLTSFYLMPDGHFVPGWTRPLTVIWSGLMLIWLFYPTAPFNPVHGETWEQTPLASLLVTLFWYSTGIFAQLYRYRRVSSPTQQQQTKWVAWGFGITTLGVLVRYGPLASLSAFQSPHVWDLYDDLVGLPLGGLFMGAAPITIGLAILRFRLWDIDPIINLTVVYLTWTVSLGLIYVASVGLFQWLILTLFAGQAGLTSQEVGLVLLLSTLLVAALFLPLRYRVQSLIDRLFYREKIDFQQAFSQFSAEVRLIIDLPALFRVVVQRLTDLLPSRHGAIFLGDGDAFHLAEARHLAPDQFTSLPLRDDDLARLRSGQVISLPEDSLFPLLLPLTASKAGGSELVGVFGLGPRRSEQPYSQKDQALLLSLAEQAGTAIAVAQLVELERQGAAYRA